MTDRLDLVALSLLPSWCRVRIAERLRNGEQAGTALRGLVAAHWPDDQARLSMLYSRAEAGVRRAETHAIATVTWSDPAYPPALATIDDPPPVLWVRGQAAVLR